MFEKLKADPLLPHKAGLLVGTIVGVLIGFVVSDRADHFEIEMVEVEEVSINGSEKV